MTHDSPAEAGSPQPAEVPRSPRSLRSPRSPRSRALRSWLLFALKLCVSLGLVAYLVWLVDWERAAQALVGSNKLPLLAAPFVFLSGYLLGSLRWRSILADSGIAFSAWPAFRAYWLGLFYGILLPGVLGGDVVRAGLCVKRTNCPVGTATASVVLERVCGVLVLFLTACLVYLAFPGTLASLLTVDDTWLIAALAAVGILGVAVLLLGRRLWLRWLPGPGARGLLAFLRSAMQTLGLLRARTLGLVLLLSFLFQATDIFSTFLLSQALGLGLPLVTFFAVMPMVYLATTLPISLGGLGVREGVLVFLLSRFGVHPSDAVTLSFLIYLNRMLVGGFGGVLQFVENLLDIENRTRLKDAALGQPPTHSGTGIDSDG